MSSALKAIVLIISLVCILTQATLSHALVRTDYSYPHADPHVATLTLPLLKGVLERKEDLVIAALPGRENIRFVAGRQQMTLPFFPQKTTAPLIYVIPGLGGSPTDGGVLFLAEHIYRAGFSVIVMPSPFFWRFVLSQSTTGVPGYSPEDAKDLRRVMKQARSQAEAKGYRFSRSGVIGYSMGGINAAFIMKLEREQPELGLERAVMINPPLRVGKAIKEIERLNAVGNDWSEQRREHIWGYALDHGLKILDGPANDLGVLTNLGKKIKLQSVQLQFIIGNAFRKSLADTLFLSQEIQDLGLLKTPRDERNKNARLVEASQISFEDYLEKGAAPFWNQKLRVEWTKEQLMEQMQVLSLKELMAEDKAFRLLHNQDDFLTVPEDLNAVAEAMGDRAILYPRGGHVGNLWHSQNLADILSMFNDL